MNTDVDKNIWSPGLWRAMFKLHEMSFLQTLKTSNAAWYVSSTRTQLIFWENIDWMNIDVDKNIWRPGLRSAMFKLHEMSFLQTLKTSNAARYVRSTRTQQKIWENVYQMNTDGDKCFLSPAFWSPMFKLCMTWVCFSQSPRRTTT